MDGTDRDLGWEAVDVSRNVAPQDAGIQNGQGISGQLGEASGLSDAMTSAMLNQMARELTQGSLSLWPQFVQSARRYFNVNHGYVLRKALWQLVPMPSTKKKSTDGELGPDKDWTLRVWQGLEVDVEEPDMYIPVMGFVTYVLLCGIVRGLQEQFHPDVLSATITFAVCILVVETTVAKLSLFTLNVVNTPVTDLAALLGYKFFYLSLQIVFGLLLGGGSKPEGFVYHLLSLGLMVSCGIALHQGLRRSSRQPSLHGQECVSEMHKMFIKALPVVQFLFCWLLMPSWPRSLAQDAAADEATTTALMGNASGIA